MRKEMYRVGLTLRMKKRTAVVHIPANALFQHVLTPDSNFPCFSSHFRMWRLNEWAWRPQDLYRCVLSLRLLPLIRTSCLIGVGLECASHRIQKKESIWEKQNYYMLVLTNLFGRFFISSWHQSLHYCNQSDSGVSTLQPRHVNWVAQHSAFVMERFPRLQFMQHSWESKFLWWMLLIKWPYKVNVLVHA